MSHAGYQQAGLGRSTTTEIKHAVRDPDLDERKPWIQNHKIAIHDSATGHQQSFSP
jgi:hypothetical protein